MDVVEETTVAAAFEVSCNIRAPILNVYWVLVGPAVRTSFGLIVWIGLSINLCIPPLPLPCGVLLRATVPDVSVKFARYTVNFKSSYWSAVHVDAFCDLNRTPAYGCAEIVLLPLTSTSPILEIQTLYSLESDRRTKQYSTEDLMYTGALNVNLVGTAALSEISTWSGVIVVSEKGRIVFVG